MLLRRLLYNKNPDRSNRLHKTAKMTLHGKLQLDNGHALDI